VRRSYSLGFLASCVSGLTFVRLILIFELNNELITIVQGLSNVLLAAFLVLYWFRDGGGSEGKVPFGFQLQW